MGITQTPPCQHPEKRLIHTRVYYITFILHSFLSRFLDFLKLLLLRLFLLFSLFLSIILGSCSVGCYYSHMAHESAPERQLLAMHGHTRTTISMKNAFGPAILSYHLGTRKLVLHVVGFCIDTECPLSKVPL